MSNLLIQAQNQAKVMEYIPVQSPKQDNTTTIDVTDKTRKQKIADTVKKLAPVIIPLAAIPVTALITYKLSSRNTQQLKQNIEQLTREMEKMSSNIEKAEEIAVKQSEKISKLSDKIVKIGIIAGGAIGTYQYGRKSGQIEEERASYYAQIKNQKELGYDPLNPPVKAPKEPLSNNHIYPNVDMTATLTDRETDTYIPFLQDKLDREGEIDIPLVKCANSQENINNAMIENVDTLNIMEGKEIPLGINVSYGKRTNWSEQKVARDIMQNFYDANGHNLDGVGISIKRSGEQYKIKISGNAVFDCKSLLELGAGNKIEESPYNAGGFGEGSKIVVASLLGQNKSDKITYASADWKLTFNQDNGSILRKLEKTPEILDGNYIEFDTKNENLVKAIIKSINFFENSNNPDFKNLDFNNDKFGFKILKPGEKGNLYLTQRFEYGENEVWDNGLEGLNLIFKCKPDAEKYKELIGSDFSTGRDRLCYTSKDIYNLTKYFAQEMTDQELVDSILKTKQHWTQKSKYNNEKPAILSFINALCDIAEERDIAIDFSNEKICIRNLFTYDMNVINYIISMGYKIIPYDFNLNKIGMEDTRAVLQKSSAHTPLQPTEAEIEKIKLLNEGARVIQKAISASYATHLKNLYKCAKVSIDHCGFFEANSIRDKIEKHDPDCEIIKKYYKDFTDSNRLTEFFEDLIEYIDDKVQFADIQTVEENLYIADIIKMLMYRKTNSEYETELKKIEKLELINPEDIDKPKFIFDRSKEISKDTLGEAIIQSRSYKGHWVDRTYLNTGSFYSLLATWLHEMMHKKGGDGSAEFTYTLTDLIEELISAGVYSETIHSELKAIEKVFNDIK